MVGDVGPFLSIVRRTLRFERYVLLPHLFLEKEIKPVSVRDRLFHSERAEGWINP
jgi:hypothetical protein